MAVKTEIEEIREEFNNLSPADRLAIINILQLDKMLAPLEKQALDNTKAMFGDELGEEIFRLGTNPDTTSEQIDDLLKKLSESRHNQ